MLKQLTPKPRFSVDAQVLVVLVFGLLLIFGGLAIEKYQGQVAEEDIIINQ